MPSRHRCGHPYHAELWVDSTACGANGSRPGDPDNSALRTGVRARDEASREARADQGDGNMKKHRVALFLNDMNAAGGIQRVAANMARDLQQDFETVILTADRKST